MALKHRLAGLALLILGLGLTTVLGPVFWSYTAAAPGDGVERKIVDRRSDLTDREWVTLMQSRGSAVSRMRLADHLLGLSLAKSVDAIDGQQVDLRLVDESRQLVVEALQLAPSSPSSWLRMLNLEILLAGSEDLATDYLAMAFYTGAHAPDYRMLSVRSGLILWDHLSLEERRNTMTAMQVAWDRKPRRAEILAMAREAGLLDVLEVSLSDSSEHLAAFEDLVQR